MRKNVIKNSEILISLLSELKMRDLYRMHAIDTKSTSLLEMKLLNIYMLISKF